MGKTPIEWCDHSINPFRARNWETGAVGHFCEKISPGCKNCYASRLQHRFGLFPFLAENREKVELFLDDSKLNEVLRRQAPTKYFWCDMTDMFLDAYPDEWIFRCCATMALTPQHTHLILTKRAQRLCETMRRLSINDVALPGPVHQQLEALFESPIGGAVHKAARLAGGTKNLWPKFRWPLSNVWFGVSVEDRLRKTRIDLLRATPAALRFLSLEPLLEDLGELDLRGIGWCIAGGESGPGARPCHPDWVRAIRDQCVSAGVPFFFKQWGEYAGYHFDAGKYGSPAPVHEFPDGMRVFKVGKKAAGALLDGREWRQFPEVSRG